MRSLLLSRPTWPRTAGKERSSAGLPFALLGSVHAEVRPVGRRYLVNGLVFTDPAHASQSPRPMVKPDSSLAFVRMAGPRFGPHEPACYLQTFDGTAFDGDQSSHLIWLEIYHHQVQESALDKQELGYNSSHSMPFSLRQPTASTALDCSTTNSIMSWLIFGRKLLLSGCRF